MKLLTLAIFLLPASAIPDPYPAPCGRSIPSGVCTTAPTCSDKGGFYVARDCTFYNVQDVGCCYDIPKEEPVYPAPCGRSIPSGFCATEDTCTGKGGFYVQRDCDFYDVLDVGCCYDA